MQSFHPKGNQENSPHAHHHHGQRFHDVSRLRSPERLERLEVDRAVNLALEDAAIQSVMDVGTGSGIFAEAFARRGLTVAGIDANPEMLKAARTYVPDADFREAEAEAIPFPDTSFDLVFMGLVLHETDDLLKAVREAYRVSRRRLVILEWAYREEEFGPGIEERLPQEQVRKLAEQAGFQNGEIFPLEYLVLYRFEK